MIRYSQPLNKSSKALIDEEVEEEKKKLEDREEPAN